MACAAGLAIMTPNDLRNEADATDQLARLVSYAPDKAWLTDKAAELRRQADALERSPAGPPSGAATWATGSGAIA